MNRLRLTHFVFAVCILNLHVACVLAQPGEMNVILSDGSATATSVLSTSEDLAWLSPSIDPANKKWPIEKVAKISWSGRKRNFGQPEYLIKLVDDSLFIAQSFTVKDSQATFSSKDGHLLTTSTRNILWIRHQPIVDNVGNMNDSGWSEILKQPVEKGDSLVINRDQSLDFLEGIVGDVSEESVSFKFGERDAQVKWDRVAGIRYYHASGRQLPKSRCVVSTIDGGEINATTVTLSINQQGTGNQESGKSKARFETPCGAVFDVDPAKLISIDWASTSIEWLDELLPIQVEKIIYLPNPKTKPLLEKLKKPSFSQTIQGNMLSLVVINPDTNTRQLKQFEHGIQVNGSTRMIWLLDGKFKRVRGNVGFDPRANSNGLITLKIVGDRETLFEKPLAKEDNELIDLDLDVTNVRRITIEIDGGNNTAGDVINFCNLRATK